MITDNSQAQDAETPERARHQRRTKYYCQIVNTKTGEPAARISDFCEHFDSAAEFAAYENADIRAALTEFLNDCGQGRDRAIARTLRELIAPQWVPPLDMGSLPVVPAAAAKLMRTSAGTCSAAELESIASSDPVLSARLLGAANSATHGKGIEVTSLCSAILRVGVPYARTVLWTVCCERIFGSAGLISLWKHSRQVAAIACSLASQAHVDPDSAWIAGLLHDIGRLLLWRGPAAMRIAEDNLRRNGFPLVYAETLLYGEDHAALGARLLEHWQIPASIVEAVRWHHRPEHTTGKLAGILCLAEDLVLTEVTGEHLCAPVRRFAAAHLTGLDPQALQLSSSAGMELCA